MWEDRRIAPTEGHVRASGYLVMRSHIEGHEALEENFRGLVVAEQSISVNVVAGLELSNRNKTTENPKQDTPEKSLPQFENSISPMLRNRSPAS